MNTTVDSTENTSANSTETKTQQTGTKFTRKKILIFFGLFLVAFGFACMTEEILGCFSLMGDGFLYLFGTTSHKALKILPESSPYLIIVGSIIIVLTLLFHQKLQRTLSFKTIRFHKFGEWKTRRAKVQAVLLLLIFSHVALVNAGVLSIPSICPLSFAELASTGSYGFSAAFFALVFLTVIIFGRAICAWGCVYGPVQEHSAGLLKTFGVNPNRQKYKGFGLIQLITIVFWISLIVAAVRYADSLHFTFLQGYKLAESWVFVGGIITFIPLTVLATYFLGNRYYCKYLCPIGGTMSFYSRFSLLRVHVNNKTCDGCGVCNEVCPMGVNIDKKAVSSTQTSISDPKCIACGECVDFCHTKSLRLGFTPTKQTGQKIIPIVADQGKSA